MDENYVYIDLWGQTFQYDKVEYALYRLSEELETKIASDAKQLTNNRVNGKVLDVKESGPIGEGHETSYQVLPWVWQNVDAVSDIIKKSGTFILKELQKYGISLTPNWNHINTSWLSQVEKVKSILGEAMSNAFTSTAQNIANKYQAAYNEELSKDYGLNFGIISNSLTAHLLYAAQATSKEMKDKERASQFASEVTGNPMEQLLLSQFNVLYPLYTETVEPALLKILSEYYSYIVSLFSKELSRSFDDISRKFNLDKSNSYISFSPDPKESLLKAIEAYPNNGNVIGFAILNDILDEELCLYGYNAPKKFDLLVSTWATDYLCNIYNEGKMFNKPLVNEQNQKVLGGLTTYCQYSGKDLETNLLWQAIVETVFADEINSAKKAFADLHNALNNGIIEYAYKKQKIKVSSEHKTLLLTLCNILNSKNCIAFAKKIGFPIPLTVENINYTISKVNDDIAQKINEIAEDEQRKREEAAKKAEEQRIRKEENTRKVKKTIKVFSIFAVSLLVAIIVFNTIISPIIKYNIAINHIENGSPLQAYMQLREIENSKKAKNKISELITEYPEIVFAGATEGDVVTFGKYEQDGNIGNGKEAVDWIVLSKSDSKVLIISKYCLDSQSYNSIDENITWEKSSIRKWLDTTFIDSAFNTQEKAIILKVTNQNDDYNDLRFIEGGNPTQDRVFLLSSKEANLYMLKSDRQTYATAYAKDKGIYVRDENGCSIWWLRSPGAFANYAASVSYMGTIDFGPGMVHWTNYGVRPAMWIDISNIK